MSEVIERAVHAAWAELKRQSNQPSVVGVYIDAEIGLIDGDVDMAALVRAIVRSMHEPNDMIVSAMMEVAVPMTHPLETKSDKSKRQRIRWRAGINAALGEYPPT